MNQTIYIVLSFVFSLTFSDCLAQCTEEKDDDMRHYMNLTKTQDAQGCSQCGMLALYFCSAKYCATEQDKNEVSKMIAAGKANVKQMGQPYCCPEYLNREPEWGTMVGSTNNSQGSKPSNAGSTNQYTPSQNGNNSNDIEKAITLLTESLQSNPENPLDINKELLSSISNLVEDESTKRLLESYTNNIGVDQDLSYRQIYWDLDKVFQSSSTIRENDQFSNTATGLNVMFENYSLLADKMRGLGDSYEFGTFLNDPTIIQGLSTLTGSYESAQLIGLGIDLVFSITESIQESRKYTEDYIKLAEFSNKALYTETDVNLNSALIDAYLGIEGHQQITPLYRYDFKNGSSLRVENGILKYINIQENIEKDLLVVDKRHDGKYYKNKDLRGAFFSSIKISSDDSLFYIYVNKKSISDIKCDNCLEKSGYIISTVNGEIKNQASRTLGPHVGSYSQDFFNSYFNEKNELKYFSATANSIGGYSMYRFSVKYLDDKKLIYEKISGLDKNKSFILNKIERKFMDNNYSDISLFDKYAPYFYLFEKDGGVMNLFWANDYRGEEGNSVLDGSSMLQIAKGSEYYNNDAMVNELTGITMNKEGDLFFINKKGNIGKLKSSDYQLDDVDLTSNIRKAASIKLFDEYDFIAGKEFVSAHGQIFTHANRFPIFPSLKFNAEENLLIYIVKDNLYLINPDNFNDVRHFKLTCQPYNSFFTKESGDWVLNIQAQNDYKFPLIKKYSLGKLSTMDMKKASDKSGSESNATNSNFSLADEIKKLKDLFDAGAITQEEYEAGKKQLLSR